jgi:hypothetical protein
MKDAQSLENASSLSYQGMLQVLEDAANDHIPRFRFF